MDNAGRVSVTPTQVANLRFRGVQTDEIIRLLVATGTWSRLWGCGDRLDDRATA